MRHKCTVCDGLGWYPDDWGNSPKCMACNGTGWRPTTAEPYNPKLVEHLAYTMFKADTRGQHSLEQVGEVYLNGAWANIETRKRWRRLAQVALHACVDDTNPDDIVLTDPLTKKVQCPNCRVVDRADVLSYSLNGGISFRSLEEHNEGCWLCDFTGTIERPND